MTQFTFYTTFQWNFTLNLKLINQNHCILELGRALEILCQTSSLQTASQYPSGGGGHQGCKALCSLSCFNQSSSIFNCFTYLDLSKILFEERISVLKKINLKKRGSRTTCPLHWYICYYHSPPVENKLLDISFCLPIRFLQQR